MRFANRNTLWGTVIADELHNAGVRAVSLAPGSRCTPLTVAFADHERIDPYSHLDERSAAFFALGRAKQTGVPMPVVCTSGTAAANFHPAVIEADEARVPMVVLTADRPRVLQDSGANQTVDQERLYGDAVRTDRTLPEPAVDDRKLRSLRTTIARAVATSMGPDPGPVHLNVPFEKPLEPVPTDDVSEAFIEEHPLAVSGRDGPFIDVSTATPDPNPEKIDALTDAIETALRGLIVTGPDSPLSGAKLAQLTEATGFPVLADPLSGHRFGAHVDRVPVYGGYDSYLDAFETAPDVVVRFGASPTSKTLRQYLRDAPARQIVVDSAGEWPEATFTATDLLTADPTRFVDAITDRLDRTTSSQSWRDRFTDMEARYWSFVGAETTDFEGGVLYDVAALAPDPSTLFVSNSMPVRDLDRFGKPRSASIAALGNRGASGIDGVTSSALGAASAGTEPLVLVTGDLAYYHDMNGLLAVDRCGVNATIVLVNNDGGGIFHLLPIEEYDPPFTDFFNTPHGLDFEPTGELYGLEFERVDSREAFRTAYQRSLNSDGTQVIEVAIDGEQSHRHRERLHERVKAQIGD
ncbi:2-succinyl-5-enolpyruvyl-6-hydroxy-3-cyclohexene-1-carboxylic-acid synthase [Halocatena pleomorpha]|uniref:2-succinyl-5-enolpyruvyl-6-hydroxy-3-cyclohexene-1-carboxylate synthase n=1 Tax=Halocatena pleomorpha TaxID=1785090 RepID=A0A3P3RBC3_9EURY|nr:2-succinyl-5-enolpyruvyl-6-hydroxy-3-cyclohexene-1-carboxylic-acid synthase [Halocatena pleomorpha]RRJ30269.1 2-succinyl-5-enolpyruvyl-6-hydroxy-3-cyclohexene-1-carboxylic-acid synthase [Halocatena pleomorpha]